MLQRLYTCGGGRKVCPAAFSPHPFLLLALALVATNLHSNRVLKPVEAALVQGRVEGGTTHVKNNSTLHQGIKELCSAVPNGKKGCPDGGWP
eukprot:1159026-Pelagomonas_calceolata.AAC.6